MGIPPVLGGVPSAGVPAVRIIQDSWQITRVSEHFPRLGSQLWQGTEGIALPPLFLSSVQNARKGPCWLCLHCELLYDASWALCFGATGQKRKNLTRMLPPLYPSLVFFHLLLWLLDRLKQREEAGGVSQCREGDQLKQGEEQGKDGWCMEMVTSKEENEAESWGVGGVKTRGAESLSRGFCYPPSQETRPLPSEMGGPGN